MTNIWPVQNKCPTYYGPAGSSKDLVLIKCPWNLYFDGKPVRGITIHKKCAPSLERILNAIWKRLKESQEEIDRIGMSKFSGSYNPRKIAGTNRWSMHAYGCAVDFDSANNWLGDHTPAMDRRVIEEFEKEGWEWGGHWSKPDGMHFQAAWTRANPPRLGKLTVQPEVTVKELSKVSEKVSFLQMVQNIIKALGAAAGGVFTADNLGLFTGWFNMFSGLGKVALGAGLLIIGFWVVNRYVINMIKNDYDEGRYVPSGAVEEVDVEEASEGFVEEEIVELVETGEAPNV